MPASGDDLYPGGRCMHYIEITWTEIVHLFPYCRYFYSGVYMPPHIGDHNDRLSTQAFDLSDFCRSFVRRLTANHHAELSILASWTTEKCPGTIVGDGPSSRKGTLCILQNRMNGPRLLRGLLLKKIRSNPSEMRRSVNSICDWISRKSETFLLPEHLTPQRTHGITHNPSKRCNFWLQAI
jgi:hypothetical protein